MRSICVKYINALLDYKVCVLPTFYFPVRIPDFCAKSRSLYAEVSMLLSKWLDFYSKFIFWVHTRVCHPVRLSSGGVVLCMQSVLRKSIVRGGFEWVRLHRCSRNDLGTIYLLLQLQSQNQPPVQILGLQGTWYSIYADQPGVRPCEPDFNPAVNPTFNL